MIRARLRRRRRKAELAHLSRSMRAPIAARERRGVLLFWRYARGRVYGVRQFSPASMSTLERHLLFVYSPCIKKEWLGPGPWQSEPDQESWSYEGIPCAIARHLEYGIWRGYIAVPTGHPWHRKGGDEIDPQECHGGITFSGDTPPPDVPHCAPGSWWIGFDCGHGYDGGPFRPGYPYRTAEYVRTEVNKLAQAALDQAGAEQTGTERLLAALHKLEPTPKRDALIERVRSLEFDDFRSEVHATPTMALVEALRACGYEALAQRVIAGEFDATRKEAEAWARSQADPEIVAALKMLGL